MWKWMTLLRIQSNMKRKISKDFKTFLHIGVVVFFFVVWFGLFFPRKTCSFLWQSNTSKMKITVSFKSQNLTGHSPEQSALADSVWIEKVSWTRWFPELFSIHSDSVSLWIYFLFLQQLLQKQSNKVYLHQSVTTSQRRMSFDLVSCS